MAERRGPRVVEVVLVLAVPLLALLVDLESMHCAGAPHSRIRRLQKRGRRGLGRFLRPGE